MMLRRMRTTVTLDPDVVVEIEAARARTGQAFKEVLNEAVRVGLRALKESPARDHPYRTPSTSLGGCRLPDVDDVASVLALAEGDGFR
jgi:hypothetical protein